MKYYTWRYEKSITKHYNNIRTMHWYYGKRTNLQTMATRIKSTHNFPKTNISNLLIYPVAYSYQGVKHFSFQKIVHDCNHRFETRLLNFATINWKITWTKSILYWILLLYKKMQKAFIYSIDLHFLLSV